VGFLLLPELSLLNRFAFAATRFRYRWTIFSPEAPAIRLAVASTAASIFSQTIRSASDRAPLPPRISFIIRSATTRWSGAVLYEEPCTSDSDFLSVLQELGQHLR
jgi:hypothetical protein